MDMDIPLPLRLDATRLKAARAKMERGLRLQCHESDRRFLSTLDRICAKYAKPFEDDDVVDLEHLEVVEDRGALANAPVRDFACGQSSSTPWRGLTDDDEDGITVASSTTETASESDSDHTTSFDLNVQAKASDDRPSARQTAPVGAPRTTAVPATDGPSVQQARKRERVEKNGVAYQAQGGSGKSGAHSDVTILRDGWAWPLSPPDETNMCNPGPSSTGQSPDGATVPSCNRTHPSAGATGMSTARPGGPAVVTTHPQAETPRPRVAVGPDRVPAVSPSKSSRKRKSIPMRSPLVTSIPTAGCSGAAAPKRKKGGKKLAPRVLQRDFDDDFDCGDSFGSLDPALVHVEMYCRSGSKASSAACDAQGGDGGMSGPSLTTVSKATEPPNASAAACGTWPATKAAGTSFLESWWQ